MPNTSSLLVVLPVRKVWLAKISSLVTAKSLKNSVRTSRLTALTWSTWSSSSTLPTSLALLLSSTLASSLVKWLHSLRSTLLVFKAHSLRSSAWCKTKWRVAPLMVVTVNKWLYSVLLLKLLVANFLTSSALLSSPKKNGLKCARTWHKVVLLSSSSAVALLSKAPLTSL